MLQSRIRNPSSDKCPSNMYVLGRGNTSFHPNKALDIYFIYGEQIDIWRKLGETDVDFHAFF